jgi:peptide/nickel transport system ATP-binding protein
VPAPDPAAALHDVGPLDEVSSVLQPAAGCPFQPRCEHAVAVCSERIAEFADCDGTMVACHRAAELDLSY